MAQLHHHTPAERRKLRVRQNLIGTSLRPRVSVHRTNKTVSAQAIDDEKAVTIAQVSSAHLKTKSPAQTKTALAKLVGETLATQLQAKKVTTAIFDRGQFRYHGRVRAVAEGLRSGGITV